MLPDVASAEQTRQDLLLAGIEERRGHCPARRDTRKRFAGAAANRTGVPLNFFVGRAR
jgi:hypothetical protein